MKALGLLAVFSLQVLLSATGAEAARPGAATNRPPLHPKAFAELPLGAIQPRGWLRVQLERMRDGLTGNLDQRYEKIVGPRNGWLGGDGDGWERGPYWLDGLVPLGWLLQDERLLAKARPWIEWSLAHQEPSGYFGPKRFDHPPASEPGIQKTPREDWWPRMVMLKVLQQHYSATGDTRVLDLMRRYFRYQREQLPKTPLDHWSFWGNRRGGDNLMVVYWLFNQTGESWLLELADLLHQQTFPWTDVFLNSNPEPSPDLGHLYPYNTDNRYPFDQSLIRRLSVGQLQSFHCVNLAQGIKQPVIYYQQHPQPRYLEAVKRALADIARHHGQPQGMFGGDEPTHGNQPTQGIELCSIVELMFSLESMLAITGDLDLADHLERIAYNALPAQTTPDFQQRQYFQCANQVLVSRARRNFYEDDYHAGTDLCFGLLTGYACCTCNMHQGWPKLAQNLWFATPDQGLAALVYAPSQVEWTVGEGVRVRIVEDTNYPFEETVRFRLQLNQPAAFPLHLRVPSWAVTTRARVNEQELKLTPQNRLLSIRRTWRDADELVLEFGAKVRVSRWAENSAAVERGPLVFALRVEEDWRRVANSDAYGDYDEIHPKSPWNYGLLEAAVNAPESGFELVQSGAFPEYPWTLRDAPLELRTRGKRIPEWQLYNHQAGPLPHSRPALHLQSSPSEALTLLPYGCTRLRVTEFPVVR